MDVRTQVSDERKGVPFIIKGPEYGGRVLPRSPLVKGEEVIAETYTRGGGRFSLREQRKDIIYQQYSLI